MQMEGLRGLHGWQWIFIIEALPTLLFAILTYFVLPDFPETAKRCKYHHNHACRVKFVVPYIIFCLLKQDALLSVLNEREREIIIRRLREDAGPSTETHFSWKQLRAAFLDWKVYMHAAGYICSVTPLYSLSMFLPSIIQGMGFTSLKAQAMSAPPYAFGKFGW